MNQNVDVNTVLLFGLKCLGIFAIIFVLAYLTPWMAKHVDEWIAKYRENHPSSPKEKYAVRSIYELPPEPEQSESEQKQIKKKAVVSVRKKSGKK